MGTTVKRKRRGAAKAAPRKRRRMGAMPATLAKRGTRRRPRKMNGKVGDEVMDFGMSTLKVGGGLLLSLYAPKIAAKITDKPINPHVINAVTGGVGLFLALKVPAMKAVGVGMASGALVSTAVILVPEISPGALAGGHTRKVRELSPEKRKQLQEAVRRSAEEMRGGMPNTLAGEGGDWYNGSVM